MGTLSEDCRFFDAYEDLAISHSCEMLETQSSFDNSVTESPYYEFWIKNPRSVNERRSRFFSWMGIDLGVNDKGNENENCVGRDNSETDIDRITESSGAVLRKSGLEEEFCSTRSLTSYFSADNVSFVEPSSNEDFVCGDGSRDGAAMLSNEYGALSEGFEVTHEELVTVEDSDNASGFCSSFLGNEFEETASSVGTPKRVKNKWLSRLRSISCVVDKQWEAKNLRPEYDEAFHLHRVQRVKVRQGGKRRKELSALYKGQDIQAHKGSILTMKFSPDGQYLASAGEDGIVRVWQVLEDERANELDIPELDPSCVYFTVDHLSEVKPFLVDKEKTARTRSLRKTSDSACVIFPPKIFRILEKPLHEFHGHRGEILDLSWSKNHHLLSASEDKTVRLWKVGKETCISVFSHSNYVTSVQFNPVDDDYFMSGSIDGKVRIWVVPSCQVVEWIDVKDIVTAVCYRPNGQGAVVGSITGDCHFYTIMDRRLQLEAQICLNGKKKSPCKRVTGLQFCPRDSTKLMVTCADSQIRVLHGVNVIMKYKGQKKAANQLSACFTLDGKQIISACEDSNVYLWNFMDREDSITAQAIKIRSFERFPTSASIAVPWCGFQASNVYTPDFRQQYSPACFSLSQEYLLESFPKGSATWPEEKLPMSSPLCTSSAMHKSQYKFLKASCEGIATSHAWGLVIVTAGWDGRIRSFHNYGLPVCT